MSSVLMLLCVVIFTFQTLSFKLFNLKYMKNAASFFWFNFLFCGLIVPIYLFAGASFKNINLHTVILGVGFGTVFVLTIYSYTKAMECGPLSYTSLFFSIGGLTIPMAFGLLLWKEKMGYLQGIGLLFLICSFYISSISAERRDRSVSFKWLILCAFAFITNGGLGAMVKGHQSLLPGAEINEFLVIAFGTEALLSLILFVWFVYVKKQDTVHMKNRNFFMVVLMAGLSTGIGNMLMLQLAGSVPAVILFPVTNGGIVVSSVILSVMIFKEKISKKSAAGLVSGIISLLLFSIK